MNNLPSTINNPSARKRIASAARKHFGKPAQLHFEHGHWWATFIDGSAYDVVDAEGGDSINGFSFEMVSEATE